jgi:hypothetical protein
MVIKSSWKEDFRAECTVQVYILKFFIVNIIFWNVQKYYIYNQERARPHKIMVLKFSSAFETKLCLLRLLKKNIRACKLIKTLKFLSADS